MTKLKLPEKFLLLGIFVLGGVFRFYNLDWDNGHHLHPDERAIVMAVVKLQYPHSIAEFFSPNSGWNPHFFAYGSLPFYLLKVFGDLLGSSNPLFAAYDWINIAGRVLSACFDLGTLLLVFYIGKRIFNTTVGMVGAFLYAVSVLPIQLSHFYAVDTLLTFFCLMVLYQLVLFYEKATLWRAVGIGIFLGLALATKVSAVVLSATVGAALVVDFALLVFRHPHKPHVWLPHLPKFLKHLLWYGFLIFFSGLMVYAVCEPYALLDWKTFWLQTSQQSLMTHNAFIFPYTLQYVGKIPYWYEITNIFWWGLGPILAMICFLGLGYTTLLAFYRGGKERWAKEVILITFFWAYFAVVGKFSVGFMRYMLPVYPLLAVFGGVMVDKILIALHWRGRRKMAALLCLGVALLVWPASFVSIYSILNTRTIASLWINQHIAVGKTIAVEHWDDALPIFGYERYKPAILPLYDPDTPEKWRSIDETLGRTDYIVIASNRLYTPLQKLTDCKNLPMGRCYTRTAQYYRDLFGGKLGFEKVAEFTDYPQLPFLGISIDDEGADESFTVYDHPKVMIFRKIGEK